MKILYINPSDTKGGAAQVAFSLSSEMVKRGHEVSYWVGKQSSVSSFVQEIESPNENNHRHLSQRVLHRLGINCLNLTARAPRAGLPGDPSAFDLIHLHDLPSFSFAQLSWLSSQAPLIWSLHSMAPFTGNCIFSNDCDRYMAHCGKCPQEGQWPLEWLHRDSSALNVILKRLFLKNATIQLIGVSQWISDCAASSRVFRDHSIRTILNAVDPARFFPVDQIEARTRLGVPHNARVIMLSVAGNTKDIRKGLDLATQALKMLEDDSIFVLPLGIASGSEELSQAISSFPCLPPRHVSDDAILRDYYASADVVWHPSRADNCPMTILEAFACGTPVIATSVGGVPELVDATNGLLIPKNDSLALVRATKSYFNKTDSISSRRDAIANYDSGSAYENFITSHLAVYEEQISK